MIRRRHLLAAGAGLLATPAVLRAQTTQKLTFYYPVAVGGPLAAIMDGYCKAYHDETGVTVEAVYAGDYSQALIKATTAIKAGTVIGIPAATAAWRAGIWPAPASSTWPMIT